jgi:centromere-localized protein 2
LFGNTSNLPVTKSHSLRSILPDLEKAADDIEAEVQGLESEAEGLLAEIEATVSGLSDLRYGKLANGNLRNEVLQGLDGLDRECEKK